MESDHSFEYTYSAAQQAEIKKIREKYLPKEENKMEQLRKLDRQVTKKGTASALFMGIVSVLLLGIGMCCTMLWAEKWFVPGIVIGVIGLVGVGLAYPLYIRITIKERERIAPEIIRLTDELIR